MEYNPIEIEAKWQKYWSENKTFKAENNSNKPKYYALDMFPYPSGAGLHVGHPLGYIASDIYARFKRHKGFNVLHPMGYDSFGLPAEQYAIQTGQHPAITTQENINRYRQQLDRIGFSFDWDREVRTSDPSYYKWTQWIFIQIFHSWYDNNENKAKKIESLIATFEKEGNTNINAACAETSIFSAEQWKSFTEKEKQDILMNYRLAYLAESYVNWCPALGTVLANDEVKDGVSERGGYPVERKLMMQWSMRITAYADRLLKDLDQLDWSESIKESQKNWIGKSEGAKINFNLTPQPPLPRRGGAQPQENESPNWLTSPLDTYKAIQENVKKNRTNLTDSESILWEAVRNRNLSFKFRRQHAIGQFIADFVCLELSLIVELDGEIHNTAYQSERDLGRTEILSNLGYHIIRFSNDEVENNLTEVLEKIYNKCLELSSTPSLLERGQGVRSVNQITVFTTRPDTIFGVSYLTLAPEHELVAEITLPEKMEEVQAYVTMAKNRSERERMADVTRITGVFTGAYAKHPFTNEDIPIWVGDYVLAGYGTGAVMAVPAHDSRDFAFAKHFGLNIKQVVEIPADWDLEKNSYDEKQGKVINSDFLNGLEVKAAIKTAIKKLEEIGAGEGQTNFRLRDAIFGRQRYWGEPIPIYYKDGIACTVDEQDLPIQLPEVDKYLPTETGEPPLGRANNWKYKNQYEFELSTMPGWAGSSWYFLRYMDANNPNEFVSKTAADYWQNVDLYIGGSEHATGHLLYVRFWTKFLNDLGFINVNEPAKKLINQGMILGESAFTIATGLNFKITEFDKKPDFDSPIIFISANRARLLNSGNEQEVSKIKNFYNDLIFKRNKGSILLRGKDYKLEYKGSQPFIYRHVPVEFLNSKSELDIKSFETWYKGWSDIEDYVFYFEEDGSYICHREVEKMSKSKYNVVNPDDICAKYGADCLRLYEMFLGPLELSKPWNTNGIEGVSRFLKKLWRLFDIPSFDNSAASKAEQKVLHKTIKKVEEDIERFSFNTSVSNFMILVNELGDLKCSNRLILEQVAILISPYAPHIAEELWQKLGHNSSISLAPYPQHNPTFLEDDNFEYPVSFNGKTRFKLELPVSLTIAEIEKEVLSKEEAQKWLEGKSPKKVIIVPKKIVNIVI